MVHTRKQICVGYRKLIYIFSIGALILPTWVASEEKELQGYTHKEVAMHNTSSDCWLTVNGKVYDVTQYLQQHPASPGTIEPWCGMVATDGMETKGIGVDHSTEAYAHLDRFLIGEIK